MPNLDCEKTKRDADTYVSPEIIKSLTENFNVLPLLEVQISDYLRARNHSLVTNDSLRCRWDRYLDEYFKKKKIPFEISKPKDMHFYMSQVRYMPSSVSVLCPDNDCRRKLTSTYKVDKKGVTPVPIESHARSFKITNRKK